MGLWQASLLPKQSAATQADCGHRVVSCAAYAAAPKGLTRLANTELDFCCLRFCCQGMYVLGAMALLGCSEPLPLLGGWLGEWCRRAGQAAWVIHKGHF